MKLLNFVSQYQEKAISRQKFNEFRDKGEVLIEKTSRSFRLFLETVSFIMAAVFVFTLYGCSNMIPPKPLPVPPAPTPKQTVELTVTPPGQSSATVKGVCVGEYYWMDANLALPASGAMTPVKQAQIDGLHKRFQMFQYANATNPTYWDYYSSMGLNVVQALAAFNKTYGSYYKIRPAYKGGIRDAAILEDGDETRGSEWQIPDEKDVLQLIAMCGNATVPEIRQYLSYNYNDKTAPAPARIFQAQYFDWFGEDPSNFDSHSNGYKASNSNKYHLNFVPAGSRVENNTTINTINNGKIVQFNIAAGDLNTTNQVLRIATKTSCLDVHDYPEMKYVLLMESFPVRFCRPLTDQELQYKLYISVNGKPLKNPVFDHNDWAGIPRSRTGEEQLLADVRSGAVDVNTVKIVKLGLNDTAPSGYSELPRGYIRGFYVQYFLNKNIPDKTVPEIIKLASLNPHLWVK